LICILAGPQINNGTNYEVKPRSFEVDSRVLVGDFDLNIGGGLIALITHLIQQTLNHRGKRLRGDRFGMCY
jgi:hypothetical protein